MRKRRYGPTYQSSKLEHQLQISPQGKATIYSYSSKSIVTCKFESLITKELFNNAIVKYHFNNKSEPLPVQSLFEHIKLAKNLGINIEDLPRVLSVFAETCCQSLAGQMRTDANSLVETTNMLIESISLKTEKRKIQTNLTNLKRTPQMEIQEIYGDLYNSYRILFEFENLQDFVEQKPEGLAKITNLAYSQLKRALRSLTSEESQRNLSNCLTQMKNYSMTVFREALTESDSRHPLSQAISLPPELIFTGQEVQAINLPETTIDSFYIEKRNNPERRKSADKNPFESNPNRKEYRNPNPDQQRIYKSKQSSPYEERYRQRLSKSKEAYQRQNSRERNRNQSGDRNRKYMNTNQYSRNNSFSRERTERQKSSSPSPFTYRKTSFEKRPQRFENRTNSQSRQSRRDYQNSRSPSYERNKHQGRQKTPPTGNKFRTPSPKTARHFASFILDNIPEDQRLSDKIGFCALCGDTRHKTSQCRRYEHTNNTSQCRLCFMIHPTAQCQWIKKENSSQIFSEKQFKNIVKN